MQALTQNPQFSQEIQKIADKIKDDVQKELENVFKKYGASYQPASDKKEINTPTPMETETKQNNNKSGNNKKSQVSLYNRKTKPFSNWISSMDEFFKERNFSDDFWGPLDPFRTEFPLIGDITNDLEDHIEKEFNRGFDVLEELEDELTSTDPERTAYFMKLKTNNNGHVKVKTIRKLPKSNWETHVEEYFQGKPSLEYKKKKLRALKNKTKKLKEKEEESKENNSIEIEDVTNQSENSNNNKNTAQN